MEPLELALQTVGSLESELGPLQEQEALNPRAVSPAPLLQAFKVTAV